MGRYLWIFLIRSTDIINRASSLDLPRSEWV